MPIRKATLFYPVFILLLFIFSLQPALAGEALKIANKKSRTFTESIASAPGKTLYVDETQADITISGAEQSEISVEAVVEVGGEDSEFLEEFLAQTKLTLEPYRDGFRLRLKTLLDVLYEREKGNFLRALDKLIKSGKRRFSVSAKMQIRVPSRQSLEVGNRYGDVVVDGVTGILNVKNSSGEVEVNRCQGELKLESSYALTSVLDFKGPVEIRNSSGAVSLKNIAGSAKIQNSYKPVSFSQIEGSLTVDSQSAEVAGSSIRGDCLIRSSYREVEVKEVQGKLEIRGQSCTVSVDGVESDVLVESSYRPVQVYNVGGSLEIKSPSSSVTVVNVTKNASVQSSYRQIAIERVGGLLDVDGSSSSVSIRDVKGNTTIHSSYRDVLVERIEGNLEIRTDSGTVTASEVKGNATVFSSYRPVKVRQVGGDLRVTGGSCAVTADDISGDVYISNSYNPVVLKQTSGSIVVHGQSSSIEVSAVKKLPQEAQIELITTYRPIILSLPKDADVTIAASSQYGKIRSDFPVYLDNRGEKYVRLELGKGRTIIRLETSGNITIKSGSLTLEKE